VFDASDGSASLPVAVANESMARQFWLEGSAIGMGFKIGPPIRRRVGVHRARGVARSGETTDAGGRRRVPSITNRSTRRPPEVASVSGPNTISSRSVAWGSVVQHLSKASP
jgi:hypothetical protein